MFKRFPIFLQDDERSCGAYCIKMILKYHGIEADIVQIKRAAHVDRQGTTIKGLIAALKLYHCEVKAYHANIEDLNQIPLPCILHGIQNEWGHFVVLYAFDHEQCIIGDPATGQTVWSKEELASFYTNNVIAIYYVGRNSETQNQKFSAFLFHLGYVFRHDILRLMRFGIVTGLSGYLISLIYGLMIDHLHQQTSILVILLLGAGYGMIELFKTVMVYQRRRLNVYMARCLNKRMVYEAVVQMCQQQHYIFDKDAGLLQSQLTDLYDLTDYCLQLLSTALQSGLTILILHIGLIILSPLLGIMSLAGCLCEGILVTRLNRTLLPRFKESLSIHNEHSQSLLSLIKYHERHFIFKGYETIKAYETAYEKDEEAHMHYQYAENHVYLWTQLSLVFIQWLCLMVALYLYSHKALTLGQVFIILSVQTLLTSPIIQLSSLWLSYPQAQMLWHRFLDFKGLQDHEERKPLDERIQSILIRNLTYGYGYHTPVFTHFYLTISQNMTMMGSNGAGKTTLMALMTGSDDHYQGDILINNHELRTLEQSSLRQHILYVGATDAFFQGTVYDNFLCQDDQRIQQVLKLLEAEALTHCFEMSIDEKGAPLSSGQRQLLSLARALLKNADVYLLDECLCHLERDKALCIFKRLQRIYGDRLFVIVSHQLKDVKITDACAIIEKN